MTATDKPYSVRRFKESLTTYGAEASVQRETALRLVCDFMDVLTLLKEKNPEIYKNVFDKILEIGCGTGILTDMILKQIRSTGCVDLSRISYTACDMVYDCERFIRQKTVISELSGFDFICEDAESETFYGRFRDLFSLVLSASAFQWFSDPVSFFLRTGQYLKSGGFFVFSSYGPAMFREVRQLTGLSLNYLSVSRLRSVLKKHFEIEKISENIQKVYFSSACDLLRHLKSTGVNSLDKDFVKKKSIFSFLKSYKNRFYENGQVYLTYHPVTVIARKKS